MEVRYQFCKCVELMLAKADTFVDLGPGTVTMVFGGDEEKVEEQCHTFPLAAHSHVFRKMFTVDMLEKASGRVEMPHISPATGRQCFEFVWLRINGSNKFHPLKGLSHEIDFKNFDQTLKNLT